MNLDVAKMVCEELHLMSLGQDLKSLTRVSHLWNCAAIPYLYRSTVFDFEVTRAIPTAYLIESILDSQRDFRHFIQHLTVTKPTKKGLYLVGRLEPKLLKVLARLVGLLPRLHTFSWNLREPMPPPLMEALSEHPVISKRNMLLTCWGLNEEATVIKQLCNISNLTSLAVEWRPKSSIKENRLHHLGRSHYRPLFCSLPDELENLSLAFGDVNHDFQNTHGFFDLVWMNYHEMLPPVQCLSLARYSFSWNDDRALHWHVNTDRLQKLVLICCQDLGHLFHILHRLVVLKQLRVQDPTWTSRAGFNSNFLDLFIRSQSSLETLELKRAGLPTSLIVEIARHNSKTLSNLTLHSIDLILELYSLPKEEVISSISTSDIDRIRENCHVLTDLSIALTQSRLFKQEMFSSLSSFTSLQHLEIVTEYKAGSADPNLQPLTEDRLAGLAEAVWSSALQTLRLVVKDPSNGNAIQWLINKNDDEGIFAVVNTSAAVAEKKFKSWSAALGVQYEPPTEEEERKQWEKDLTTGIIKAGSKALAALE